MACKYVQGDSGVRIPICITRLPMRKVGYDTELVEARLEVLKTTSPRYVQRVDKWWDAAGGRGGGISRIVMSRRCPNLGMSGGILRHWEPGGVGRGCDKLVSIARITDGLSSLRGLHVSRRQGHPTSSC